MRYFAYGSNICQEQMKKRGLNVSNVEKAILPNHQLVFSGVGRNWENGGVANIIPKEGSNVYGALYTIEDILPMDKFEKLYSRKEMKVQTSNGDVDAWTYFQNKEMAANTPSQKYLTQIIDGLNVLQFKEEYVLKVFQQAQVGI